MRSEQEFLVDVLQRLNSAGVDSMLTGSMASNFWGTPRTTHDVDIVVLLKPDQVDRFAAAFEHGFFIQRESVRAVFQPPYQFNVLDEQSALKADFWQLRQSPFEQEMFRRRLSLLLFGTHAWVQIAVDDEEVGSLFEMAEQVGCNAPRSRWPKRIRRLTHRVDSREPSS